MAIIFEQFFVFFTQIFHKIHAQLIYLGLKQVLRHFMLICVGLCFGALGKTKYNYYKESIRGFKEFLNEKRPRTGRLGIAYAT